MAALRVVCVKWGDKYGADYVLKLRNMVARNLGPHEFLCLTERPVEGVPCQPLPTDLPSWWSKIGLFKPGVLPGANLYLDLDVVITASLDPLAALLDTDDGLWARDDFSYSLITPRRGLGDDMLRLLGGVGTVNSSVMLWRDDVAREVWDRWEPGVMDVMHGDQNHISSVLWPAYKIRFIPDHMVGSYKYNVMRGDPPATVVVFHGDPKPPQVLDRWLIEAWR